MASQVSSGSSVIRASLLALALAGCGSSLDLDGARLVLERKPTGLHAADFRGYRVEIGGDGAFVFVARGLDGVERAFQGAIEVELLGALFGRVRDGHFFELADHYGPVYNDMVFATLEVRLEGSEKRVSGNWLAGSRGGPWRQFFDERDLADLEIQNWLFDLAHRVDLAAGTQDWLARAVAAERLPPGERR